MPMYTYKCGNKHHFEKNHSMLSEDIVYCPKCGLLAQKTITSVPAVSYQSPGFYRYEHGDGKVDRGKYGEDDRTGKPA